MPTPPIGWGTVAKAPERALLDALAAALGDARGYVRRHARMVPEGRYYRTEPEAVELLARIDVLLAEHAAQDAERTVPE